MRKKLHYLIFYTMMLGIGVLFNSCENDIDAELKQVPLNSIEGQQSLKAASIETIRQKFIDLNYEVKLTTTINDTLNLIRDPEWNTFTQQVIQDSISYTYIPLTLNLQSKRTNGIVGILTDEYGKEYIIAKSYGEVIEFFRATYIFENTTANKSKPFTKDFKAFTGRLLLTNLKDDVTTKLTYNNSKRQVEDTNLPKQNKTGDVTTSGFVTTCYPEFECYFTRDCPQSDGSVYIQGAITRGIGSCSYPENYGSYCGAWRQQQPTVTEVCTTTYVPDPVTPTDPYVPPTTGGGGGTTSSTISNNFDSKLYLFNGTRPTNEYPSNCTGTIGLWSKSLSFTPTREVVGVLTTDGKVMEVAVLGFDSGTWGGLYNHDGKMYYTYPTSQGAPSQTYQDMIVSNNQYFIPIKGTIHTHSPCVVDGTNGISNINLSTGDKNMVNKFPMIDHYIIGCNAVGKIYPNTTSPTLIQSGALSSICNAIQ